MAEEEEKKQRMIPVALFPPSHIPPLALLRPFTLNLFLVKPFSTDDDDVDDDESKNFNLNIIIIIIY